MLRRPGKLVGSLIAVLLVAILVGITVGAVKSYRLSRPDRWTHLDLLSDALVCAIVKSEDRRFYIHSGLDFSEISNAIRQGIAGSRLIGASTISQQTTRNLFLSSERSWTRKILEALMTVGVEAVLTKAEILAWYVNVIDWGPNVRGIREASNYYFAKPPDLLNLGQAIFLASVIAAPQTPIDKQQQRLSKVASRVNRQLAAANFYSIDRMNSVAAKLAEFFAALAAGESERAALAKLDGPIASQDLFNQVVLDRGCGIYEELGLTPPEGYAANPKPASQFKQLLQTAASQPSPVLSVSPQAERYIEAANSADGFGIRVVSAATRSPILELRSNEQFHSLVWHPDGERFFFQKATAQNEFEIWQQKTSEKLPTRVALPGTKLLGGLYTCSKGQMLAYYVGDRHSGYLKIIDAQASNLREIAAIPAKHFEAFALDDRCEKVAIAGRGSLRIVEVRSGTTTQLDLPDLSAIKTPVWHGDALLAPARVAGDEYFKLYRWNGKSLVAATAGEVGDVVSVFSVNGTTYAYVVENSAGARSFVVTNDKKTELTADGATLRIDSKILPHGLIARAVSTDRPARFYVTHQTAANNWSRIGGDSESATAAVTPEAITLPTASSDVHTPAYLWRAKTTVAPKVLIKVHGGPEIHANSVWNMFTQEALRRGISVLELNYRGSTGYGSKWQSKSSDVKGQLDDLNAAIEYSERELGVLPENIGVYGWSYGSGLALELFAQHKPKGLAGLFLASLTGPYVTTTPLGGDFPVYAYLPDRDHISPEVAQGVLRQAVCGSANTRCSRLHAITMHDEPHTFARRASWLQLYADIFTVLADES